MDAIFLNEEEEMMVYFNTNDQHFVFKMGDETRSVPEEDAEKLLQFLGPYLGYATECGDCGQPLKMPMQCEVQKLKRTKPKETFDHL